MLDSGNAVDCRLDQVRAAEGLQAAATAFERKLQQEGLFREMKQRKFYEKPSVKRKRKEKEAQRRLRKKMRMMRKD